MADTLALLWPRSPNGPLRGAVVGSGGKVGPTFAADGPVTGESLKTALAKANVSTKRTVVALPRSLATVRRLNLPGVPDADLPDLVRMQAATKSAAPLDQLALDFLPLPPWVVHEDADAPGRAALLASVPAATLRAVRDAAAGAGLELAVVGVSAIGAGQLIAGRGTTGGTTLIVARDGDFAELTLLSTGTNGPHVAHTHAAHPHGDDGAGWRKSLLSECSRVLISSKSAAPTGLSRCWAIGAGAEELAAGLAERFECEATAAEDWAALGLSGEAGAVGPGPLAGPIGLANAASAAPGLDFLSPRKKPAAKDNRLRNALLAAGGAAVLLGGGYWYLSGQKAQLRDQIAVLDAAIEADTAVVARNQLLLEEDAALSEWRAETVAARDQLAKLDALLPGTDRLFLTDFDLAEGTARSRPLVKLAGYAEGTQLLRDVERDLAAAGYVVSPTQSSRVTGREGYPVKFELSAEIPPDAAADAGGPTEATPNGAAA